MKKPKTLIERYSIAGGCFFAGIFCILAGSQFQGELLGKGRVNIGINRAFVTVSGSDAQFNINFFWVGAVVFFIAALIHLIITAHLEMKTPQPFGDSDDLVICPTCERPFSLVDLEKAECPDCHIDLVKLRGFYNNPSSAPNKSQERTE